MGQDERGYSLVGMMLGAGLLGLVSLGVAKLFSQMGAAQVGIQQKFEALEVRQHMLNYLHGNTCRCNFSPVHNISNSTPLQFTIGNPILLDSLYRGCDTATPARPTDVFVTANAEVPGTQSRLRISTIQLTNLVPIGPWSPREFSGEVIVGFQPRPGVISINEARLRLRVTVAAGGPPFSVESCEAIAVPLTSQAAFTTVGNSTFTVPPGVQEIFVRVLGGGGGGGGSRAAGPLSWVGGGGGAGGYAEAAIPVTPGQIFPVVVGRGGAGAVGDVNDATGEAGGTSSFGTVLASGGLGGRGGDNNCAGGWPGSGSGGDVGFFGGHGGDGTPGQPLAQGGHGGGSKFGSGGRSSADGVGIDAQALGSGGGGGYGPLSRAGGRGADGAVVINYSSN